LSTAARTERERAAIEEESTLWDLVAYRVADIVGMVEEATRRGDSKRQDGDKRYQEKKAPPPANRGCIWLTRKCHRLDCTIAGEEGCGR
jgi:hypothetical protein